MYLPIFQMNIEILFKVNHSWVLNVHVDKLHYPTTKMIITTDSNDITFISCKRSCNNFVLWVFILFDYSMLAGLIIFVLLPNNNYCSKKLWTISSWM